MTLVRKLDFIIICLSSVLCIRAEDLLKGRLLSNIALHSLDLHLGCVRPVTVVTQAFHYISKNKSNLNILFQKPLQF